MDKNNKKLMVSDIGEFTLIERIRKVIDRAGYSPDLLVHGIGDDTAVFKSPGPGYEMLVTCDTMVEGRHYLRDHITPMEIGRRAMVMNISDIGAMGGEPLYSLVSLGLRSSEWVEDIEEIYRGFIEELETFGAGIIGGNISRIDGSPFIDITLIGRVNRDFKILRSSARSGDAVMVTGCPGRAAAGYWLISNKIPESGQNTILLDAYLRPRHRAREGHALAMSGRVTSMIDISDGLSGDLLHICESSNTGVEIKEEMLPSCMALEEFSNSTNKRKEDIILGPSDDYELLFTCSHEYIADVNSILSEYNCPVTNIGEIVPEERGMTVVSKDGERKVLLKKGWDHFNK